MKWKRIPKELASQPTSGIYSDWKELIADEASNRCVYCAIHDASFGGIRNFHVEHFRPKSIDRFAHLKNDIRNLYYACPVCNTFKSNDWPSDTTSNLSIKCYPDPSQTNYCDIFDVDETSGIINGKHTASKYMVEKIYLNRPQLIMERRMVSLRKRLISIIESMDIILEELENIKDGEIAVQICKKIILLYKKIIKLYDLLQEISPYRESDIER